MSLQAPHKMLTVFDSRTQDQSMLYSEIIAVCSQIHTKHTNTLGGQNVVLSAKSGGVYNVCQPQHPSRSALRLPCTVRLFSTSRPVLRMLSRRQRSVGLRRSRTPRPLSSHCHRTINPLTPNDPYSGRTAPLTSKLCILYIYSTNIGTEYFKHGIYSPFFALQNAVCFIILTYLVPVLFTFYIQVVLKFKKIIPASKG